MKNLNIDLKTGITATSDASDQDIAEANERKSQLDKKMKEIENEKNRKANKKASGVQKLKDLGLTSDEIQALIT